ncbi:MAG: dTDP-glucose 4,6-dehydratase [Verrucomicrobiales bacterium]|nr:dTDP-glucose 4,6-dehydratase [Verrucomicrobiales bacterium]
MRILVTGAAGFIGSNLVHYLLNEAEEDLGVKIERVVNFDKLTYAGNPQNLRDIESDSRYRFVQGDIGDAAVIASVLEEEQITAVMHLAAESHVDRSIEAPEEFIMTNFVGTFQLLHAANAYHRKRIEQGLGDDFRFLHVSTDEVYGSLSMTDPAFSETTPYAPNSPYSASKAGSDHLVRSYFHTFNLPVVTTNCSNNYGPYQFPEKLIPLMIGKARRGEKLPVYGDGSNVRDWLFVKDHCRGLALALVKGRLGEVYNIGGKCEMKNIDVVRAIIAAVNDLQPDSEDIDVDAMIEFVTDRPGHDHRYAINCDKIESELGWQPQESFASGLQETVKWYFDNDEWIDAVEQGTYQGQRLGL